MRHLSPVVALVTGALVLSSCTAGSSPSPGPTQASPSPTFQPTAASPQAAVDQLREAWRHGDREAASQAAPEEVVSTLFRVSPKGWSPPRFRDGVFRLRKHGVPGSMQWTVQNVGTGYFVGTVQVPPIPLRVSDLSGRVWGLYLAAGGSGYSQLAAATAQLQELGLTDDTIAQLPASCQSSVAERLQIPAGFFTVAVFFERKSEAEAFEAELDFPAIGLLKVTVRC